MTIIDDVKRISGVISDLQKSMKCTTHHWHKVERETACGMSVQIDQMECCECFERRQPAYYHYPNLAGPLPKTAQTQVETAPEADENLASATPSRGRKCGR